ncbi:hypothetical protein ACFRFH_09630 [Leifsonia sp. NPDC056824]|uniref:hypothetical protein n=1 Tax=Leifsonia sp. NPDC056824 TaxID=3345953 RepID=UPI00367778D5
MTVDRSKALLAAVLWTALAVFAALLVPFLRLWILQLAVVILMGLLAVSGWAAYVYYRRHPEAEHIPTDDRSAK